MNDSYHHGDLRRALIDAAVDSIAEAGPSALSLRAVAKRAGVSHAAPAHHFGDKAGLLTAVAIEGFDRFADAMERAWNTTADFRETGVAYVRFAIDNRAYFETMFRPELLHEDDPELQRAWARARMMLQRGTDASATSPLVMEDVLGYESALAAWSIVHGFAELLFSGNFPPAISEDPEAAVRAIVSKLQF